MSIQLPPELDLSPHLSAHKYFLVCTLTVAAWDTLVLSPRAWRLWKSPGWPALKGLFHFLRIWMPAEFVVVAVAFFDTKWTQDTCQKFYLFEPICTAVLLAATSAIHVIRIHAIYDKNRAVLAAMSALFAVQVVVTGIACAFYRSVPLLTGQGCIAGPKHTWVGIYWVAPTLLYAVSFGLALMRSLSSLKSRPLSKWKLMLRDGLNLYGAILLVNLTNVIFWFAITPTGTDDPIRTIVTSMAAVLTTSMSLRIILSVRGPLTHGGSFALSGSSAGQTTSSRLTTHVISRSGAGPHISTHGAHGGHGHTYTLDELRTTGGRGGAGTVSKDEWAVQDADAKSSVHALGGDGVVGGVTDMGGGVKVTIDREIGYDDAERYGRK